MKLARSCLIISSGFKDVGVELVPSGGAFGCGGSGDDGGTVGVGGGDGTLGDGWCKKLFRLVDVRGSLNSELLIEKSILLLQG